LDITLVAVSPQVKLLQAFEGKHGLNALGGALVWKARLIHEKTIFPRQGDAASLLPPRYHMKWRHTDYSLDISDVDVLQLSPEFFTDTLIAPTLLLCVDRFSMTINSAAFDDKSPWGITAAQPKLLITAEVMQAIYDWVDAVKQMQTPKAKGDAVTLAKQDILPETPSSEEMASALLSLLQQVEQGVQEANGMVLIVITVINILQIGLKQMYDTLSMLIFWNLNSHFKRIKLAC